MRAWALTALVVIVALVWLQHRANRLAGKIEQGARAPLNMFSPRFWGMKDDGSTFGTRGWWSNIWSKAPESGESPYSGGAPDVIDWDGDVPIVKN